MPATRDLYRSEATVTECTIPYGLQSVFDGYVFQMTAVLKGILANGFQRRREGDRLETPAHAERLLAYRHHPFLYCDGLDIAAVEGLLTPIRQSCGNDDRLEIGVGECLIPQRYQRGWEGHLLQIHTPCDDLATDCLYPFGKCQFRQ